jgi:hypothetical protein
MSQKPDYVLKVGDTLPKLEATLINKKTGQPIGDITSATVVFRYKVRGTAAWVSLNTVAILNGPKAIVEVTWSPGDTSTVGDYDMEFVVTFPAGVMTVPNVRCLLLRISEC